jgi:hypothetical protein
MIGLKFIGRLGNQLFQYAFFQYLKTNNPDKTIFFINPHHGYLTRYFDLGIYDNLTLSSKIYSIITRLVPRFISFKQVNIEGIQVPKELKAEDQTTYTGYYQTDFYLRRIKNQFTFKIREKYVKEFQSMFGEIFSQNKTIVVHIRRTDYLTYGKRDISLPIEYFQTRIEMLGPIDDYKVFFVSDDIEYVKSYFKEKPNYIFSNNNEIIDFQIIKNADIAIISNSSFGWWAAYLSDKENTVYAPKNWLGFRIGKEHPKRIMTDRFIWCDVLDTN